MMPWASQSRCEFSIPFLAKEIISNTETRKDVLQLQKLPLPFAAERKAPYPKEENKGRDGMQVLYNFGSPGFKKKKKKKVIVHKPGVYIKKSIKH